jgi:DUF4097 and DUF4098 domain-containing protein YvlB
MENIVRIGKYGLLMCGLLFAGCYVHIGGCQPRATCEKTVELTNPLAAGSTLKVHTASGSIKINGTQTGECSGIAKIRVHAPSQARADEIAEQVNIALNQTPGQLEIKADRPRVRGVSISISYDLTVPVQTDILADTASGSIRLAHLQGDMDARTASGSVRMEDVEGGPARLKTASGSIRIDRATLTSCNMHTASGSLTCEKINCPEIVGNTASGSVRVTCTPDSSPELRADLSTSSGSVRLDLPQGFAGKVEMSTHSGSVSTKLPIAITGKVSKKRVSGTVGNGNGDVRLATASGSVRLN